ncbi:MAG: DnaJ C-terminal domain-containing protein [Planctomycetota bacterium]
MAEDYYQTLGVPKNASADEIQKAYRKQARKYHPDLHADKDEQERKQATQKFQQIQQAYDVLSDPEKRKLYDQFGPQFEQMAAGGGNPFGGGGSPFGGGGAQFDFSQLFGGGGGGGGFEDLFRQMGGQSGQPRPSPAKGEDLEQQITVPFAIAVLGGKHQVSFKRNGKVERIDVKIPAGIESGKKIRLRGQGQQSSGGAGDLLIKVDVAGHPNYARKGLNLLVEVPISILEAAEGAKIDIPTPHGTVAITVPAGTSSGKTLRLKGMGIKAKDRAGDLLATLKIQLPDSINDADLELLKQLSGSWQQANAREELVW